ncbi:hypothetical protein ACHAXS_006230 [Conticribra weissflogii]
MDQFVVKTPGRLPTGYGREAAHNKYTGGTIFHDAASGFIGIENQVSLGVFETIGAKQKFEQWLWELACVEVSHYRSDNGVFTGEEFRHECEQHHQKQSFSGVGAKHQNARAERAIQTIIRVPNIVTGLTPLERLTSTKADHRDLLRTHVWGCPVFVLDPSLQDGKKIPKWNKRSRLGQFLGYSDQHSSLIANVRHLRTGFVSPQYHCVFDDLFQTVYSSGKDDGVVDSICNLLWENNRERYAEDEYDSDGVLVYQPPPLDEVWLSEPELRERKVRLRRQRQRRDDIHRDVEERIVDMVPPERPTDSSPTSPPPLRNLPELISRGSDDESVSSSDSSTRSSHRARESEGDVGDVWPDHPSVEIRPAEPHQRLPQPEPQPEPVRHPIPPDPNDDEVKDDDASASGSPPSEGVVHDSPPNQSIVQPRSRKRNANAPAAPTWRRDARGRLIRAGLTFAMLSRWELHALKSQMTKAEKQQYYVSLNAVMPETANFRSRKKMKYRQRMNYLKEQGDRMMHLRRDIDVLTPEQRAYNAWTPDLSEAVVSTPTVEDILNSPLANFIDFAANDCGYSGSTKELICNWVHPLFLKAKSASSQADNPNWWQAMNGPFANEYWKAAVTEIETLEGMDAWEVVDQQPDMNVIDSTWAFKLKRFPDGLIKKFKARFCARGDQQIEGVDFFETYAPVVQWTTVRLMLILEVLLGLKSKQGDVTAAFLHADIPEDGEKVYVKMPLGFEKSGKVLRLKKTLYGLRQSPRAFWKYMVEKMALCNMPQSQLDPCLFIGNKVICICYVDDLLFWAKDEKDIHDLAIKLRELGVDLEQEDDAAGILGVRLEKNDQTGQLEMKQTGLIDRVLEALGLDSGTVNGKLTPAEGKPLVKDSDGEPARGTFSYPSVVGMLLYLSGHSRPDIAYAVNCAARYMFCPKRSHEEALKRLGRYLKATRDRGLILDPQGSILKIDNYPDADFAGMFGYEKPTDPASAKSRTGYVITVAACPVLWQSKLQTETALSTMEAEIVALAHSCRELFPIMDMVSLLGPAVGLEVGDTTLNVSIHEDNAGALVLAETLPPQYTPRSKHYHIKTIWFREAIVKRGIKLVKIDTVEQLGDLFTKGLARITFEYLREKLMGW